MAPLLELRNVSKIFGGGMFNRSNVTVAVDDISFTISEDNPEITTIAGESGSGKSTMARLLLGVTSPTYGTVFYKGKALATMTRKERKEFRREVQPIFQDPFESYNPFYKVDHVLERPAKNFEIADSRAARTTLIEDALTMVGLQPDETLGRYPHQLSGGQRQRVMIAIALSCEPKLLIADEATTALDVTIQAQILELLENLKKENGMSILIITHDLGVVAKIAQKVLVMYAGEIVESGPARALLDNPLHPYTKGLIASVPKLRGLNKKGTRLEEIPGNVPSLDQRPSGCAFHPRCAWAIEKCKTQKPQLRKTDNQRQWSCHLEPGSL